MNPKIKQRWTSALRSGEYQQGRAALRVSLRDGTIRYCCLGVLCDLYSKATGVQWQGDNMHGMLSVLPDDVCRWADIKLEDNELTAYMGRIHGQYNSDCVVDTTGTELELIDGHYTKLPALNDEGANFVQLADLIEKKF
jgi:hypothetical protein